MTSQRDSFPSLVKDVLAKRAGQHCSNPGCRIATSGPHEDPEKTINLGVAAHITAAAPGGPRYNPGLSPEERSGVTNGIWLCQTCAKLVDSDTVRFPEKQPIMWRRHHEEFIKTQMAATSKLGASTAAPGVLVVSAVHQQWPVDGRACILDFRVSNQGASDVMIDAVEFRVLDPDKACRLATLSFPKYRIWTLADLRSTCRVWSVKRRSF